MIRIVATEDQARSLAEARDSVEIVDASGKRLGWFARPFDEEDVRIALARLASAQTRRTTAEVVARLESASDQ